MHRLVGVKPWWAEGSKKDEVDLNHMERNCFKKPTISWNNVDLVKDDKMEEKDLFM